jgi:prepilin-type processing-associated H-X9-DG protein
LPYIEQGAIYSAANYDVDMQSPPNNTVVNQVISLLICPSEIKPFARSLSGGGQYGISNYGYSMGDWFVWGGLDTPRANRSAFGPNQARRLAEFRDGTSNTLWMSEGRAYLDYARDCPVLANVNNPDLIPPPDADPYTVAPEYISGCAFRPQEGRTQWFESGVHHNGFTTAWPPNKTIPGGPNKIYPDVDVNSSREKLGRPSFAAITARSYHPGGVNVLLGDGSVRPVKSSIDGRIWRALGTAAGNEAISADAF